MGGPPHGGPRHGQHIDVPGAELPVSLIQRLAVGRLLGQQGEDEAGDQPGVEGELGHEALNPPQGGTHPNARLEADGQPLEADRLHLAKSTDE